MIMGVIIMNKRYSIEKYVSVLLVTLGIILCTFYSNNITNKKVSFNYFCLIYYYTPLKVIKLLRYLVFLIIIIYDVSQ